jgi:hypothetical protein
MQKKKPDIMRDEDTETVHGLHRSSSPALSRSVQTQIGQRLRQFYETLALGEQPVPDRFIEIINRLDERKPEKQSS